MGFCTGGTTLGTLKGTLKVGVCGGVCVGGHTDATSGYYGRSKATSSCRRFEGKDACEGEKRCRWHELNEAECAKDPGKCDWTKQVTMLGEAPLRCDKSL